MVLVIDNYDSFVYNLARYIDELGFAPKVVRNDAITLADIATLSPDKIVISPGPCDPLRAGISLDLIRSFGDKIPILGVCLGHQAIGQAYGGKILRAKMPMHGKSSVIYHNAEGLFANIPQPLKVARYHSLIVEKLSLPASLEITAECATGEIMALAHKHYPVYGVQFHPESIITEAGHQILKNFLILER